MYTHAYGPLPSTVENRSDAMYNVTKHINMRMMASQLRTRMLACMNQLKLATRTHPGNFFCMELKGICTFSHLVSSQALPAWKNPYQTKSRVISFVMNSALYDSIVAINAQSPLTIM